MSVGSAELRTPGSGLARWLQAEPAELKGLLAAFACALCMFAAYSVLRPIRDTMGISSGWSSLPWLFWAVFICMLLIQPVYGWLVSRMERARVLPVIYGLFALMIVGFWAWFGLSADHTWIARVYFVWVSVFNLFVVSVFWSLMAEVFTRAQAARLFGVITAGISTGGLLGPALAGLLAVPLGTINLLLISAMLLLVAAGLMRVVVRWHRALPQTEVPTGTERAHNDALAGGVWDGFVQVARSPYLLGIAGFVLMITVVNTVLYLEQQRLVGLHIRDRDAQTQLFALLDFIVQAGALLGQLLLFSRMQRWFGFRTTLAVVPTLMLLAFALLALSPGLTVVLGIMLVRRIGEFSLVRPSRDMLFTVVSTGEKYKAKNLIDTFVYRGGDALSASGLAALAGLAAIFTPTIGLAGMLAAAIWLALALWLGRRFGIQK